MSLRTQIASLLLGLSCFFVVVTYLVQLFVILPAFEKIERQSATRNVSRCVDALKAEIATVARAAQDWGSWDDMHLYAHDHNQHFADGNLSDESFGNTELNLICVIDTNREIVWGQIRDIETLEEIDTPDLFEMLLAPESPFIGFTDIDQEADGIVLTSQGPIMIASQPIVTTKRELPIRGSVIFGRFLNPSAVEGLAERTHIDLQIANLRDSKLDHAIGPVDRTVIEEKNSHELVGRTVMSDVYGNPAIQLSITHKRIVKAQGNKAATIAAFCSLLGGVFTLALIWLFLSRRVVAPLRFMADHAVNVGQNGNLKAKLESKRIDEIGTLSNEFDRMVQNLNESRKKMQESAHRAGMSDIASEVLHSVGNSINSVNCSAEFLRNRISKSKIAGLEKATSLLNEHGSQIGEFFNNDPRAPKLVVYLSTLNEALKEERDVNLTELSRLSEMIHDVSNAVAAQSKLVDGSKFKQEVSLQAICDEAIRRSQSRIDELGVQVVFNIPTMPDLNLHKLQMTQAFADIVKHAVSSLSHQSPGLRRLEFNARLNDENGLEIDLVDNGSGFESTAGTELFTHRNSSENHGNGPNLHNCANFVRKAGGEISASSPGPGLGARYSISLPNVVQEVQLVSR